ncbi:MAG TPA: peptidylprolyl isomerase, partial [Burkholderiaceae bacterium]|nr:peptidylprolyl isomerase [Burkholderiaceae bacterium]
GQLQRGDTVPEFEKAIFEDATIGVLPKLVATRYGFHIIAVDKRVEGTQLPFDLVREKIAETLRRNSEEKALSQYVRVLAGNADIQGVDLEASASPLVQ